MLTIENLTIDNPKIPMRDLSFTFEAGKIYTILGRTGAGKTELLRALIGLQALSAGSIMLDDECLSEKPINARQMALVYQQFINYPHLNVLDNVAFPLRRQGIAKGAARELAMEALAIVGLEELSRRRPSQLSGGQQQRVAIARAMVKNARILLLDEPLANLDYKLREQMREEFPRLLRSNQESVILYTTTEPQEAMQLGDVLLVMHEGQIVASGDPVQVFENPPSRDVASVISDPPISFLSGQVKDGQLIFADGSVAPDSHLTCPPDGPVTIALRPDAVQPGGEISAQIDLVEFSGSETIVHLAFPFGQAIMLIEGIESFKAGQRVNVSIVPDHIMLFATDGRNITERKQQDG